MFRKKGPPVLSEEERALYLEKDEKSGKDFFATHQCAHCGGVHARSCPRVASMRFENKQLIEVTFFPPGTWDDGTVVWPEAVYESGNVATE